MLKLKEGDSIRCGVLDKGMTESGEILKVDSSGVVIAMGKTYDLTLNERPNVDLILGRS